MTLTYKIKKAFEQPGEILPYFYRAVRRKFSIKRVLVNGELFYQYGDDMYPGYLANQSAAPFIFNRARSFCCGIGLDIGAGSSAFPGSIAVQNDPRQNAYQLDNFADESLDYIFSSHCLEHLERWQEALGLWMKKIRSDGILFLYLPHQSMRLWHPKGLWAGTDHKWIPTCEILLDFLANNGMEIVEYNPDKDEYWSFHIVARKKG